MKKKWIWTGNSGPGKQKIFCFMRFYLMFTFFCAFHALAGNANSQERVNLKLREASLMELFREVQRQTGLDFVYNEEQCRNFGKITIQVKNETVEQVLEKVFHRSSFAYRYENGVVMVRALPPGLPQVKGLQIRGKVTDKEQLPLPGVAIVIKGTSLGVSTDEKGEFVLALPQADDLILVFTFVGMKPLEIPYKGQTEINVVLEPQVTEMEEVVVTGIFNRRAESFTGSAQTITKEELRKVGHTNLLQSLKNLDPSFQIMENLVNGSNPNVLPEIQLRGQSGFPDLKGEYQTNPNQPLFILDGFEASLTKIIDLDMDRVESVTLLKDAAAKAIYGSKAANGVVVIETKRPAQGKMQVTYTASLNMQIPDLTSYDLCNAAEKLQVEKDAGIYDVEKRISAGGELLDNADTRHRYQQIYNELLEEVLRGVDTDWKSKPLRLGIGHKHTVYLEGGDEAFRYGVDFSYNNIKGVMKDSDRNTLSGGITLSYRYRNFTFRESLQVSYNKGNNSPYGVFSEYTSMNPYLRPEDANGEITRICGQTILLGQIANPLWNRTINTKDFSDYTELINNFYAEWLMVKGLKLTGRVSVNKKDSGMEIFHPATHTEFIKYTTEELSKRRGRYTKGNGTFLALSADVNANYSAGFGKHLVFANIGWSLNSQKNNEVTIAAEGFPNDHLDDITFARQYVKDSHPAGKENKTRDLGILGALNYSYDDRYLLDASFRASGSSQFGNDSRWGKFWSFGLGWNLHNEAFMENARFLNQLKIRASLGYTGSQNFNSYQSKATYTYYINDTYYGHHGAYLMGMQNEKLRWQRKYDRNIGVDASFLERRLSLRLDYYFSDTDDLLTDVTIPSSTGFTSYKENVGEVENKGYEFKINYRIWTNPKERSSLNLYVAGSHNTNRIRKISNSLAAYNETQAAVVNTRPVVRYAEGQSLSAIWAVPSRGIDPACGKDIFITRDGAVTYQWNPDDLAVVGDSEPELIGNCGFNLDYKGFSLNVGMNWKWGGQIYNQTLVDKVENANRAYNVDRRIFEHRWVNPGDVTLYKDAKDNSVTRATQRFVEDQNEWTISSVNVSYDFDRFDLIRKAGFRRLRLSVDMADVCRVSSVKIERGTAYPFARSFSLSLQAMF